MRLTQFYIEFHFNETLPRLLIAVRLLIAPFCQILFLSHKFHLIIFSVNCLVIKTRKLILCQKVL
jgi:hypothetical protein